MTLCGLITVMIIIIIQATMLKVEHLAVNYQDVSAVEDVSFSIDAGQVVGVIEPNGAMMMALTRHCSWLKCHCDHVVKAALERVGMWELKQCQIGELSGGQQQSGRVRLVNVP
jgi:ABC-type Mn2+/Zn2+ transport system ATPase subunit